MSLVEKNVNDSKQIANGFNNYFVNIDVNLSKEIPISNTDPLSYMQFNNPDSIYLQPVDSTEVLNIIKG